MVHSEGRMAVSRVGCAMTLRKKLGGSGGDKSCGRSHVNSPSLHLFRDISSG